MNKERASLLVLSDCGVSWFTSKASCGQRTEDQLKTEPKTRKLHESFHCKHVSVTEEQTKLV